MALPLYVLSIAGSVLHLLCAHSNVDLTLCCVLAACCCRLCDACGAAGLPAAPAAPPGPSLVSSCAYRCSTADVSCNAVVIVASVVSVVVEGAPRCSLAAGTLAVS
jgi:hypothetical protein